MQTILDIITLHRWSNPVDPKSVSVHDGATIMKIVEVAPERIAEGAANMIDLQCDRAEAMSLAELHYKTYFESFTFRGDTADGRYAKMFLAAGLKNLQEDLGNYEWFDEQDAA